LNAVRRLRRDEDILTPNRGADHRFGQFPTGQAPSFVWRRWARQQAGTPRPWFDARHHLDGSQTHRPATAFIRPTSLVAGHDADEVPSLISPVSP